MPTTAPHTEELARLQAENERDEQRLRYYENHAKYLQHEIKSLTRKERNHRIFTRGGMLEKFLHYPNDLTDDQVYELLRLAFRDPALRQREAEMKQANDFRINHGGDCM